MQCIDKRYATFEEQFVDFCWESINNISFFMVVADLFYKRILADVNVYIFAH